MKRWLIFLLGILAGLALVAAVFLLYLAPRGDALRLLPTPSPAPVLVQVDGAVQHPGVYRLPREARAGDAVTAAGGFTGAADTAAFNLAARVADGQKIVVPVIGAALSPASTPAAKSSNLPAPGGAPLNINTATSEALQALPGIGPTRAGQIIAYRESHGGFKTVEEIQEVSGIGPATFERLKDLITVD